MNITIRKAVYSDIDKICDIESGGNALRNRQQFIEELKLNFATLVVIENGEDILGYAVFWRVADEIQLNNIGIKPECRRQGLGTLLLTHIMNNSYSPDFRPGKIILEVSSSNIPAVQFYKKNGFIEAGRRKNYYKNSDAIL